MVTHNDRHRVRPGYIHLQICILSVRARKYKVHVEMEGNECTLVLRHSGLLVGSFSANTNAPVTNTDSITLVEGGTATTTTAGATSVLTNDTDPDGDALTADFTQGPVNAAGGGWAYSNTGHLPIPIMAVRPPRILSFIVLMTEPLMETQLPLLLILLQSTIVQL